LKTNWAKVFERKCKSLVDVELPAHCPKWVRAALMKMSKLFSPVALFVLKIKTSAVE
jgi:hypothetical protein